MIAYTGSVSGLRYIVKGVAPRLRLYLDDAGDDHAGERDQFAVDGR